MNTTVPKPVRPAVRDGDHPIESTRYLLETPAIEEFFAQVVQWVTNRIPGAIIFGRPRRGKSKAIILLIRTLARLFPGMPVLYWSVFDQPVPNQTTFLEILLEEAGHAIVEAGKTFKKLSRLADFLAGHADAAGQNRVVLIIDEAQELSESQYKWLIGVHNALERRGANLIVLLVGQHQLLQIRTGYIAKDNRQIVGRFMVHVSEFHGLRNEKDLTACLHAYDEDSEFPVGSGWSFTRYYLPEWFEQGCRLEQLAPTFWAVISEERKGGKAQADYDVPMQDFARTVEHFLRIASSIDPKTQRAKYDLGVTDDVRAAVRAALSASGYLAALKLNWKSKP